MRTALLLLRPKRRVHRLHLVHGEQPTYIITACGVTSAVATSFIREGEPDCPDCIRKMATPRRAPARPRPEVAARIEERTADTRAGLYAQGRAAWGAGLPWDASPKAGRRAWEDGWMDAAMETLRASRSCSGCAGAGGHLVEAEDGAVRRVPCQACGGSKTTATREAVRV